MLQGRASTHSCKMIAVCFAGCLLSCATSSSDTEGACLATCLSHIRLCDCDTQTIKDTLLQCRKRCLPEQYGAAAGKVASCTQSSAGLEAIRRRSRTSCSLQLLLLPRAVPQCPGHPETALPLHSLHSHGKTDRFIMTTNAHVSYILGFRV